MSRIDMIFCNTDFNLMFPLATCKSLPRSPSDQWEDGATHNLSKPRFRFEKWCIKQSDFAELVNSCWNRAFSGSPIEIWQCKIRNLRKKIKGWSINVEAAIRKKKYEKLEEFDVLDKMQESQCVSQVQNVRLEELSRELNAIWELKKKRLS